MTLIKSVVSQYSGFTKRVTFDKPIRIDPDNLNGIRGQAKNKDKSILESTRRAKRNIFDIALQNPWTHWGTLTLNTSIDRTNFELVAKSTTQRFNNIKKRDPSFKYLMVFEEHKAGGYHMHLFLYTDNRETDFERAVHNGRALSHFGRSLVNWKKWRNFGYTSFLDISHTNEPTVQGITEKLKISNYISKYITKDFAEHRFNKKKYWCSKGLEKPVRNIELQFEEQEQIPGIKVTEYSFDIETVDEDTGEVFNLNSITTQFHITPRL